MYRMLKANGKAIFIEPLGHNMFINAFRKLTSSRRTLTEKLITYDDVKLLEEKSVARIEDSLGISKLFAKYCWISVLCLRKK